MHNIDEEYRQLLMDILINGVKKEIDLGARLLNNRTVVPIRYVAEALNLDVQWDDLTKTVILNTK